MRQSGSALRKLIRSVAAAGLWSGGVGKDQERYASRKSQSETRRKAVWDGPLIGPALKLEGVLIQAEALHTTRPFFNGAWSGDFQERCHSWAAVQAACIKGSCPGSLSSSVG